MTETTAERLRAAADLIEQTAEDLCPAWRSGTYEDSAGGTRGFVGGAVHTDGRFVADVPSAINAHWIALMGPQIAAPLAAWLRAEADDADLLDAGNLPGGALDKAATVRALDVADAILGACSE